MTPPLKNGPKRGLGLIKWSERLESNQRPLSPQNRTASYLIDLWCRSFAYGPATFRKRSPVFGAIMGAALALATPAEAGNTVTLGDRPGGYAHAHIKTAERWLKTRTRIVIAGDQASAAAIQVVYFHERGGRICAKPGVTLYFHAGRSRGGAVTNANRRYLGRDLKDGWYHPEKFGIREC